MQAYTAQLRKRAPLYTPWATLPSSIVLNPRKWSATDVGGSKTANIEATGTLEDLSYLLTWLGDDATIENEMGSAVWSGIVFEVEANLGGVTVSLNLENVFNRVAVLYTKTLPDGSTESAQTAWGEDAASIARYGRRDWLYSLPDGVEESAVVVRDRLLAQYADPAPVISTRGDYKVSATLFCRGRWAMLDSLYWQNAKGLISHEDGGGGVQAIGAALTANTISFGASAQPPGEGGDDYIKDSGGRFGTLEQGTVIKVTGAVNSANNGKVTVQHLHGTDVIETVEDAQVNEAAGATVTVALGEFGLVGWVSQEFKPSSSWLPTRVAFRVRRIGSPGDNLGVTINLNDGGAPGSNAGSTVRVVARGTISGTDVPTAMQWVEIPITPEDMDAGSGVSLWSGFQSGQTYWVTIGRSGGTSLSDYYDIALDDGNGYKEGSTEYRMKVFNGSVAVAGSWVTRDNGDNIKDADLNFRIIGEVDSIEQLQAVLAVLPVGDFLGVLPQLTTSGLPVRSFRGTSRNVLDEVKELLDLGTSNGRKLLARVDAGRNIIIEAAPESNGINPMLGMDGRLRHASGALWEPGALVAGRWVDIESMPVLDGLTRTKGQRAVYIEECEYDATRDRMTLQSEGSINPWQAIRWERR